MSARRWLRLWKACYWVLFVAVFANEIAAYLGAPGIDWRWATADLMVWIVVGIVVFTDPR